MHSLAVSVRVRLFNLMVNDCDVTRKGLETRYRNRSNPVERSTDKKAKTKTAKAKARRRKRQRMANDGRAPDTTDDLVPKKRRQGGRRRGGLQAAPTSSAITSLTHGIPWSYEIENIRVTNTCPLDSFLMLLYKMRRFGVMSQYRCVKCASFSCHFLHFVFGKMCRLCHV